MICTPSPARSFASLAAATLIVLCLLAAIPASAASWTVNTNNDLPDTNPGNGTCATVTSGCSLRAAVMESNALAGDDLIYENTGKHIVLGSALVIESNITIYGHGSSDTTGTRIDCDDNDEAFTIRSGASLEVQNARIYDGADSNIRLPSGGALVLRHCVVTGGSGISGGGIRGSSADITLDDTVVSYNVSTNFGGGIALDGASSSLNILNGSRIHNNTAADEGGGVYLTSGELHADFSTVDNNTAAGKGGGIYLGYGSMEVEFSTIQHNVASRGGGAYAYQAEGVDIQSCTFSDNEAAVHGGGLYFDYNKDRAYLTNVTISGNSADDHGGGIYLDSDLSTYWGIRLFSCTLTENIADADHDDVGDGGGIYRLDHWGSCELLNTILAGNYDVSVGASAPWAPDCAAELDSLGYNLIGVGSGSALCSVTEQTGDRLGTGSKPIDPMLGPLGNSGGYYTEYHMPESGSPVIDNADPDGCIDAHYQPLLEDQRGEPRQASFASDIGSVESSMVGRPILTVTTTAGGTVSSSPAGISCPGDCSQDYSWDTIVWLTATPTYIYDFTGWGGDADCDDGFVRLLSHTTCTATFTEALNHTVIVYAEGTGSGTVRWHLPNDITFDCAPCGTSIRDGDTLTLEPLPSAGSVFSGWTGDPDCSDGVLVVTSPTTCTANFEQQGAGLPFTDGFESGNHSAWSWPAP